MGLMDYFTNNSEETPESTSGILGYLSKMKAPALPASRQQIIANAMQKLANDPNLGNNAIGGIAQGLLGFASGNMQGNIADQALKQQTAQRQALSNVFSNLSKGNASGAIGSLGDAAKMGYSPEDLARFKSIIEAGTNLQTTRDANGNPVFTNAANAMSNGLVNAPQQNTEYKTDADIQNNQAMRQEAMQRIGIDRANLGMRQQELVQGKTPQGYRANPDGTLSYIKGGPADPSVKAAAKPLPGPALKQVADNNSAMSAIDNALNVIKGTPNAFGAMGGLAGSNPLTNNMADNNNVLGRAAIADIGSKVIHDRSGAAVTIAEMPRLAPFIPSAYDSAANIEIKLNQLSQKLAEENQGLLDTYGAQGYNINDELKNLSTNRGTSAPSSQPSPSNQPSYQEGQTATNPKTGQVLTFRNGAWQ